MSTRAQRYDAAVVGRAPLSAHLVRLTLSVPGFVSSGIPDEWVGLVVPGQFQVRYYTVRALEGDRVVLTPRGRVLASVVTARLLIAGAVGTR